MSDQELDFALYQLILKNEEQKLMDICLSRAKKLGEEISSLTPSQLNGVADLAIDAEKIDLKEVYKRNDKRWKNQQLKSTVEADEKVFQAKADQAVADSDKALAKALGLELKHPSKLLPIAERQLQFKMRLLQVYLTAAVEFARVKQSEGRN